MHSSAQEKIAILFKEYDALRAEILCRFNNLYTLVGISVTLFIAMASFVITSRDARKQWPAFSVLLGGAGIMLGWMYSVINRNVLRCGFRIREIERRINELAGDTLLEWESRWGGIALANLAKRPGIRIWAMLRALFAPRPVKASFCLDRPAVQRGRRGCFCGRNR